MSPKLELAFAAIGGKDWDSRHCDCDETANGNCRYCTIHAALRESMHFEQLAEQIERDTTIEERLTWVECPTCGAKRGENCIGELSVNFGTNAGLHIARLRLVERAPKRIRIIPLS